MGATRVVAFDKKLNNSRQPLSTEEREQVVDEYFRGHVDNGSQRWRYAVRHPALSARALNHLLRLPSLTAELSDTVGGRAIWDGLMRERPLVHTPVHSAVTVLALPDTPEEYALGRSKQTLRRKARDAEKRGVHWALVTDPAEKLRLADLADARDRTHPREEYRTAGDANRALMVHPLWLAAYGSDDRPILVSITPTDGQWAILQYFRILEDSPEASSARYLLTRVLAEHLVARGVRYLADNASPMGINNGLRHYQRMLGFRIVRVRPRRARQSLAGDEPVRSAGSPKGAGAPADTANRNAGLLRSERTQPQPEPGRRQKRPLTDASALRGWVRVLRYGRKPGPRRSKADYAGSQSRSDLGHATRVRTPR